MHPQVASPAPEADGAVRGGPPPGGAMSAASLVRRVGHQGKAPLRLSPDAVRRLPQSWNSAMADAAQRAAASPDAEGWIRVEIPIESAEQALPELLGLDADAEILAPAELRERMTEPSMPWPASTGALPDPHGRRPIGRDPARREARPGRGSDLPADLRHLSPRRPQPDLRGVTAGRGAPDGWR
ncbi:WYL domain-containing protein [Streptomyces sp. NPDC001880]